MLQAVLLRMMAVFPAATLIRGQEYQSSGNVLNVRLSDGLLKARVKGSSSQLYDIHIDLKTWPKSPARCSCQQQSDCQHVAACLYELESKVNPSFRQVSLSVKKNEWHSIGVTGKEEVIPADSFEWYSDAAQSDNDFFSYQLGIIVNNKAVSIVPVLIDLMTRLTHVALENLSDSTMVKLAITPAKVLEIKWGRIKPLLRILIQYCGSANNSQKKLEIARYQLILMQEAEFAIDATKARWNGTAKLKTQLEQLVGVSGLPVIPAPQGLQTLLRDYQQQGLNWLQFLRITNFGGVLADDMGLGKTIQTLAHLQYEKEQGRLVRASLIVAPTSLVWNWFDEALRFTPQLKVLVFHGTERHNDHFNDYDVVISTYGLIQRDKARFLPYNFYYIILDEAQSIKNSRTKTTQIVQQLNGQYRLCLTGTPLENHLGELWSLFHFLMPGLLGDAKKFYQFFRIPIEKGRDNLKMELLVRRISPFMLRRSKEQVARELPAKTEMTRMYELSGTQRDLYESIRMSMEKKVRDAISKQGSAKSHIILLDALLRLRQICCDPRLLSLPEAAIAHGNSVKLNGLMELIDNLMEEKRSVLVFSQFTSMLKLIEEELLAKKYPYLKLTGKTQNRAEVVRDFQAAKAPIFLISLKAGGTGLNLTKADTVIHYDPWWNPAVEDQATDRSHRIGQENPVFVYKLISIGTVEEVILSMQAKKRLLFDGVLSAENVAGMSLSDTDIAQFFAPLA